MTAESKTYLMLPNTKRLLEEDIQKRRDELVDISKQGADLWEGDQWHSSAYRDQQVRKEFAIRFLQLIDQKGGRIEVLSKPVQDDIVEIGHMVKAKLLDDPDVIEAKIPFSVIHVLTKEDVQYLGGLFDNLSEMIVSLESPIGSALQGKKRGEVTTYLQRNRLQVLDSEDAIKASNLFDKEQKKE
jgi:transcription elongation GreA/GreB family factor